MKFLVPVSDAVWHEVAAYLATASLPDDIRFIRGLGPLDAISICSLDEDDREIPAVRPGMAVLIFEAPPMAAQTVTSIVGAAVGTVNPTANTQERAE